MSFNSFEQTGRLKYADKLFENNSYFDASEAYEDVLERSKDSSIVASKIAVCYDKIGNEKRALDWHRFLSKSGKIDQQQQLRLGLLEREFGNYSISEKVMKEYSLKYGSIDVAESIVSSTELVSELQKENENYKVKIQNVVNTNTSEMGVSFYTPGIVMIANSNRKNMLVNRTHSWTGNYYYDLYLSSVDSEGNLSELKRIKSKIQSKYNDGPAVFNPNTGFFYFTRNNFFEGEKGMDENREIRLKIYKAKIENGDFIQLEELKINSEQFSNAHPTITSDGKRMYFSSDRPGGFGGMDIYYVDLDEKGQAVGNPINLGSTVNTSQVDAFPHFNNEEQLLFFSSEGHVGLGGLDVFVAKLGKDLQPFVVENLGAPINSIKDDLSFIVNEDQSRGYFSSNREGGKGDDDIYMFNQLLPILNSPILSGNAKDLIVGDNLENVKIYLVNDLGEVVDSALTDAKGEFGFELKNIKSDFVLTGTKDNYEKATKKVVFDKAKKEYNEDVLLNPIIIEGKTNLADLIEINPIYFDLNSSYIRKDAAIELDKVVSIMNEYPGMIIELGSHTDTRETDRYNEWLSDRRAKSSANYIISKGISQDRISGKGYGEYRLIHTDEEINKLSTEEEKEELHQKNRRTEFIVVKMK